MLHDGHENLSASGIKSGAGKIGMINNVKCIIYRCGKKDEMYLYVPWAEEDTVALDSLPPALFQLTGKLTKVMELELSPDRKLSRANANDVIASIEEKGFYIQMPPNELLRRDESMLHNPSDSF